MDAEPTIDGATAVIGSRTDDDIAADPVEHAATYATEAPALAAFLNDPDLEHTAAVFQENDRRAGIAQKEFKAAANRVNVAVVVTAVASAALPLCPVETVFIVLGLCAALGGAVATYYLRQLNAGNLLREWMKYRAKAESHRLAYFNRVTRPLTGDQAGDRALRLLRLEYFRRYQLDHQDDYYRRAGCRHDRSAKKTLKLGGFAAALSGCMGVIATGVGIKFGPEGASLAVLAVFGAALAGYATTREETNQDKRNAERYERTAEVLGELRKRLDPVRKAVAAGDDEALSLFVTVVHEQLSLEHRQWLEDFDGSASALTELEARLAQYTESPASGSAP